MTIQCPERKTTYLINSRQGHDCKVYGLCTKCVDWILAHQDEIISSDDNSQVYNKI